MTQPTKCPTCGLIPDTTVLHGGVLDITRRDFFAGMALIGQMNNHCTERLYETAFQIADAMIAASEPVSDGGDERTGQ